MSAAILITKPDFIIDAFMPFVNRAERGNGSTPPAPIA
jgi:hypothetical protein